MNLKDEKYLASEDNPITHVTHYVLFIYAENRDARSGMNITAARKEFEDDRQIKHLETTSLQEYQQHVEADNFLFVDSHDHLVDAFSGRCFAASKEQLDALISYLKDVREALPDHDPRYL
ncbi:TPA: hypothetical protein MFN08_002916 [Klebsiella pneumoniae]|nr:hypothetical protein [Klebsiella pneumoniae]